MGGLVLRDSNRYGMYPFIHKGKSYQLEVSIDGFFESFVVSDDKGDQVLYYSTESELDDDFDDGCYFDEDKDYFYVGEFCIPKKRVRNRHKSY